MNEELICLFISRQWDWDHAWRREGTFDQWKMNNPRGSNTVKPEDLFTKHVARSTNVQSIDIDCNIRNRSCGLVVAGMGQLIYSFGRLRVVAHEENDGCDRFLKQRRTSSARLDQTRPQIVNLFYLWFLHPFVCSAARARAVLSFQFHQKDPFFSSFYDSIALFFSSSRPTYLFHSWKMVNGLTFLLFSLKNMFIFHSRLYLFVLFQFFFLKKSISKTHWKRHANPHLINHHC